MTNELTEYKNSPVENIKTLLGSGLKVSELKEFLELQKDWERNEAEKAFHLAMSEFKKNPPEILKTRKVSYTTDKGTTQYSHAELGEIAAAIGSALSEHGLNATWKTEQEGSIKVTCTITHKLGHSESTSLVSPPDTSGGKNSIQAIGSTIAYLQRYTLLLLTGLAAKGMDDDGNNSEPEKKKELTPENKRWWNAAKKSYMATKSLKLVLEKSELSDKNNELLIYECAREVYERDGKFDAIEGFEGLTEEIKNRIIDEER